MQPLTDVNSPEDQMVLKGITGDRSLSATSKKAYAMRLRLWPPSVESQSWTSSLRLINPWHGFAKHTVSCALAVLAAVRQCPPKFALRLPKAQQLWLQELLLLDRVLQQRYKSNLPTARQAAGHVPWANIVKL